MLNTESPIYACLPEGEGFPSPSPIRFEPTLVGAPPPPPAAPYHASTKDSSRGHGGGGGISGGGGGDGEGGEASEAWASSAWIRGAYEGTSYHSTATAATAKVARSFASQCGRCVRAREANRVKRAALSRRFRSTTPTQNSFENSRCPASLQPKHEPDISPSAPPPPPPQVHRRLDPVSPGAGMRGAYPLLRRLGMGPARIIRGCSPGETHKEERREKRKGEAPKVSRPLCCYLILFPTHHDIEVEVKRRHQGHKGG